MAPFSASRWAWFTAALVLLTAGAPAPAQNGHTLNGAGPVSRSMAGASTAMPVDASGALYWNPAAVSGLERSEVDLGLTTLQPIVRLTSAVAPGALGPGVPPVGLAGSTRSDTDFVPMPAFAFVWQPEESDWTFGLGMFTIAGLGVNYPANLSNPINTPQPPNGLGFGAIYSELLILQLVPAAAYRLTDHVSVGFAPTLDLATLAASPFPFAPPDDADGDGRARFPDALRRQVTWGAGFFTGVYYRGDAGLHLGASFKSPQWFESYQINSEDERGFPRRVGVTLNHPLIVSLGVGYSGLEHFLFAADFRYLDYRNTKGFDRVGFGPTGALAGLGWDSIFVAAFGMQYDPGGPVSIRLGYSYGGNPIDDAVAALNVAAPSFAQHAVYSGFSYRVTAAWTASLMYGYGFNNSIEGPLLLPGPIPGTAVRSEGVVHEITAGVSVRF